MRNAKYLNAREYAEMLSRGNNYDVADFAEEFLDALDVCEETRIVEIEAALDGYTGSLPEDVITNVQQTEWHVGSSELVDKIEAMIEAQCPEYADMDTDDAIADMLKRLKYRLGPPLEYDL